MLNNDIGFFRYKQIIKESNNFIYHDKETGRMIKLDKDCLTQMKEKNKVSLLSSRINSSQIEYLSSKQKYIHHSYLPCGILKYNNIPIGVIYPKFFEDYKTFRDLYKEDSDLLIKNLKQSFYNNLELISNDIYNRDLSFKNIMYKDNNVELIDLDGRFVGNHYNTTYDQINFYYLYDLYECLEEKIKLQYKDNSSEVMEEIKHLFTNQTLYSKIDSPLEIIEEIEKKKILK